MKKANPKEILEIAYKELYNCNIKKIDKKLDLLLKAKKLYLKNHFANKKEP